MKRAAVTYSKEQERLAGEIYQLCVGGGLIDATVATTAVLRLLLTVWPENNRLEILAGVISDLKSAALKHNV